MIQMRCGSPLPQPYIVLCISPRVIEPGFSLSGKSAAKKTIYPWIHGPLLPSQRQETSCLLRTECFPARRLQLEDQRPNWAGSSGVVLHPLSIASQLRKPNSDYQSSGLLSNPRAGPLSRDFSWDKILEFATETSESRPPANSLNF